MIMLKIKLINMQFYGNHGATAEEKKLGQTFQADVIVYLSEHIKEDNLERTVDYVEIYNIVKNEIENKKYNLIEFLAESIAEKIHNTYSKLIIRIIVRIRKPAVPINGILDYAEAEIDRNYE